MYSNIWSVVEIYCPKILVNVSQSVLSAVALIIEHLGILSFAFRNLFVLSLFSKCFKLISSPISSFKYIYKCPRTSFVLTKINDDPISSIVYNKSQRNTKLAEKLDGVGIKYQKRLLLTVCLMDGERGIEVRPEEPKVTEILLDPFLYNLSNPSFYVWFLIVSKWNIR